MTEHTALGDAHATAVVHNGPFGTREVTRV